MTTAISLNLAQYRAQQTVIGSNQSPRMTSGARLSSDSQPVQQASTEAGATQFQPSTLDSANLTYTGIQRVASGNRVVSGIQRDASSIQGDTSDAQVSTGIRVTPGIQEDIPGIQGAATVTQGGAATRSATISTSDYSAETNTARHFDYAGEAARFSSALLFAQQAQNTIPQTNLIAVVG